MAEFNGQIITNKGRDLLGRALAGEGKIIFTKAAFGDQKHQGNARDVIELKNKKLDLTIMHIRNDSGTAVLTIQATNEHVEESFKTEEFGVYAKLENDKEEILYSYTTAIEADFFPNNKLGTTYEFISEVYMAIDSNTDPEIHVKEGVVFLTRDIADEVYTSTGIKAVGELKERTNLEENKAYRDNLGKWYKNIGGNRSWNKSDKPDNKLVPITWDLIFTQQQEAEKSKVNVKDIVNNLTSDASDKPLAAAQGKILEQLNKAVLGKVDGSFPLTSATKDKVYYCQPLAKFYRCKESYSGSQLTSPNDKFYEISVFDNSDRLNNLIEVWISSDGTQMYEKYSNGILKQYLTINQPFVGNYLDVTFPLSFMFTDYFLTVADYPSTQASIINIGIKDVNQITLYSSRPNTQYSNVKKLYRIHIIAVGRWK